MKLLIYSSKEIYDDSSFEGRAEADLIAYALYQGSDEYRCKMYKVMKDRLNVFYDFEKSSPIIHYKFGSTIERFERNNLMSPYIPDMPS